MGLADFEIYIQERLRAWDDTVDLAPGSPLDTQVIQPVLRRLGTDPFTMDAAAFVYDRLAQEHPEIAVGAGDATTDLLVNQALMLWDPIIREIKRVSAMISFGDPYVLNTAEAEALGANLFAERNKGKYSRGVGRIYFSQPQNFSLTQSNYVTASNGRRFFPVQIQSIRREEMMLNSEGELYYFDANFVAESAGEIYNIEAGALATIANVTAAVRIVNKSRFRGGLDEDDAVAFVGQIARELTERSLVTLRGIVARLAHNLPEITHVQVIGFGDEEMQRDIVTGGSLGPILLSGSDGEGAPDGHFRATSFRFQSLSADFYATVGPAGDVSGVVATVVNAFTSPPGMRDIAVTRVIDKHTLELAESVIDRTASGFWWTLRRWELTLSGLPGGILFPDGSDGSVSVPSDQIHIGGCTDTYTRSQVFDSGSLVIDSASDDAPLLTGLNADPSFAGTLRLQDLVLGVSYSAGDEIYQILQDAAFNQYTLELLQGNNEGPYRVLKAVQTHMQSPVLFVDPAPPGTAISDASRWRLIDELDIDLVLPKETRIEASDGQSYQGLHTFTTLGGTDFNSLGVSVGDVLRIETGRDAGDYEVESLLLPNYATLKVDRPFRFSSGGLRFRIFRANRDGGVHRPLIRINNIDLLDTTGQPVGLSVPYAHPVEASASSFSNTGRGVRVETKEALIGLVSVPGPFTLPATPQTLVLTWQNAYGTTVSLSVDLTSLGTSVTADALAAHINTTSSSHAFGNIATTIVGVSGTHCAIRPPGRDTSIAPLSSSDAVGAIFGIGTAVPPYPTAGSIRVVGYDWTLVRPTFSPELDTVQLLDGVQPGFYDSPEAHDNDPNMLTVAHDFEPEINRTVRVGSRSLGTARVFFLQPTSFEVDQDTVFSAVDGSGISLDYKPDPFLSFQMIPPLPSGAQPEDGEVLNHTSFRSVSHDFIRAGVREGDILSVTFKELIGSHPISDPVVGLAGTTLVLSVDDTRDKAVTFLGDTGVTGEVTREGVVNQINAWVGLKVCSEVELPAGSGDYFLVFNYTKRVVIRSVSSANSLLGFDALLDSSNDAASKGNFYIVGISPTELTVGVTPEYPVLLPSVESGVQFQVTRPKAQRISTTAMAQNKTYADLYYFDVELVSKGSGDVFNISHGQSLAVRDYRADGYYLSTDDTTTSFSPAESVKLHLSRSIIAEGADDSPVNATQVSGQQLSISYEFSSSVQANQNFQLSEFERVVCQSPLARSLVPHFVRFSVTYAGGSGEPAVQTLIEKYINDVGPGESVESSDIQKICMDKRATSVVNPLDLVAVVHDLDRSVYVHRSQDRLTTGRLAAFVPDVIRLVRSFS